MSCVCTIDMETLSTAPPPPPQPLPLLCILCPIRNGIQRCPPVKENLRWKGSNSISNFHHHNICKWGRCRLYITSQKLCIQRSVTCSRVYGLYTLAQFFRKRNRKSKIFCNSCFLFPISLFQFFIYLFLSFNQFSANLPHNYWASLTLFSHIYIFVISLY
jgi:hypothetical protein